MRPTLTSVLGALCAIAMAAWPATTEFTASTNPIPYAALDMTYKADRNVWLFVDKFAVPYERMLVQLCVARDASSCSLASVHVSDTCASLSALAQFSSPSWRAVDARQDPCLDLSRVNASMRSEPPNSLALDNDFVALRAFDVSPDRSPAQNTSNGSIVLRVRFVYIQNLGPDSAHVHSLAYEIEMCPLQDSPGSVVVQSECGARGLRAPHSRLSPALGGSIIEVVVLDNSGTPARVCMWQCQLPYLKMPWNALPLTANTNDSSYRAVCVKAPSSFTTTALTIPMLQVNAITFDKSQDILVGVDSLAERMAAMLLARFGPVRVLISLRGSTYNARQVQEVLDWSRSFQRLQAYDFVETVNRDFTLKNATSRRRLLQESDAQDMMLDVVIVADVNPQTQCCLGTTANQIPRQFDNSSFDFGVQIVTFGTPQVESTSTTTQRQNQETVTMEQVTRRSDNNSMHIWLPIVLVVILLAVCFTQQNRPN